MVTTICDHVIDNLSEDNAFSVQNFGTLSPYLFHGHQGFNIASGRMQYVKPFKTVRFRAPAVFKRLSIEKRERFEKAG